MKVVFLRANHLEPDPRVEKEAAALLARGYEVLLLGWDREGQFPSRENRLLAGSAVPVIRARIPAKYGGGLRNLVGLVRFQWFLLFQLLVHRRQVAAIHACDFSTVIPGFLVARTLRVPLVYDIFDYYVDSFPVPGPLRRTVQRLDKFMIEHSDAVIVASEDRVQQLRGAEPRRVAVVHNSPQELEIHGDPPAARGESKCLVYVGQLLEDRLLEEVLQAMADRPDWIVDVAGFGPLEDRVSGLSTESANIRFHGRLSYDEALKLQAGADLMFATYDPKIANHRYSAPNKFYEALLLGKPIIVCKGTGVDELVDRYDMGATIEYSAEQFAAAADRLVSEPGNVERVAQIGPAIYREHFSWEIMSDRLTTLYEDLLPGAAS